MSESSLSVISFEFEDETVKFLKHYLTDEKDKNDFSVKNNQNLSPMNYITSLASSITNAWSIFLSNPQFKHDFKTYIKDENVIAANGISYFLSALIKDTGYSHMNQYVKLCFLTIQIDLLDFDEFAHIDSADLLYVDSLSALLNSDDKQFLYDCYLNLIPIVLKPLLDAFPFKVFLTYSKELAPNFTDFSSLDIELRSYKKNHELLNTLIVSDLKKLTINDCSLKNMTICNVLNKQVDKNGDVTKVYWGHSDTVYSDLAIYSEKLSNNVLKEIQENKLTKNIRKVSANLLYLPNDFANVSQQERLSMKYLSHLAKSLNMPSDDESSRIFCHRNVLTNIIIAINNKSNKGVNFRVYKTNFGIFLQPMEELKRSDDYKTNPAVRAGFGFENFLSDGGDLNNSYTYLMNSFTLGNKDFYVQSEIDSCSPDCESFYELKTIAQKGYVSGEQWPSKCLRSWAQNFFIPNNPTTLLGVRSKSFDLTQVLQFTQSELLDTWNRYYGEDKGHLRSHKAINEFTLDSLSRVFDYIKVSVSLRSLKNNNCVLLKNFNVKYKNIDESVHPSCFFSHEYDLTAKNDISKGDLFVRQALEALYNDHEL